MTEQIKLRGRVYLEHRNSKGELVGVQVGYNVVTQLFKELITSLLGAVGPTRPSHMSLGSGTTPPAESNAALVSEIGGSRTALSSTSVIANEISYAVTITAAGVWSVNEVGLWNASSGGTLCARWLSDLVTLQIGETLSITWTLSIGGA